jgi:hypothetical protein
MRNATYAAARLARAGRARGAVALLVACCVGAVLLAGCAGRGPGSPAVPTAAQPSGGAAAGRGNAAPGAASQGGAARAAALHAAAQCIRQHGIPSYADPVLTSDGRVYSDRRSIQDASPAPLSAIQQACGALAARAGLNPEDEPPAPPQLIEVGVRAAQCMRAHGLPNDADPSARTPYTPGHGFGMTGAEMPAGGKASPVYQRAAQACRSLLDDEIRASTLSSLGHDG